MALLNSISVSTNGGTVFHCNEVAKYCYTVHIYNFEYMGYNFSFTSLLNVLHIKNLMWLLVKWKKRMFTNLKRERESKISEF